MSITKYIDTRPIIISTVKSIKNVVRFYKEIRGEIERQRGQGT